MYKSLKNVVGAAAVLTLVLAGAVLPTRAQDGEFDPNDFGKESSQSVTVGDSTAAFDKFAHARRMERLQQWNIAADLYQDILRDFPDRVVQSHSDPKTGYVDQYTSVRFKVIELMSKWPVEGLNSYRAKYEPIAAAVLASAGSDEDSQITKLSEVFNYYFTSDSGKIATLRLIDIYFEKGQFSAAAWRGEMLFRYHPNLGADRPAVLFRSAVAFHLLGDTEKAKAMEAELKAKHADATGSVQGQTVNLVDALKLELANARVAPQKAAVASGRPGAKLCSIPLSKPAKKVNDPNDPYRNNGLPQPQTSDIGIFPVEDNGQLFFQDGQRIYAVDIESGLPLPGWAQTYGGERKGQYLATGSPAPRWTPMTVTVTESNVLAVMGMPRNAAMAMFGGQPSVASDTRLICLDRTTGQVQWTTQTKQLPASAKAIQGVNYVGTPLVNADTVFVAARGGKGGMNEDCYMLAYDLKDGKFKWSCFISSATVGNPMWGGMPQQREMYADLAYDSGRVYILTNLGTLGAVDAYSGAIVWLSVYPREDMGMNNRMMMMGMPQQPKPIRPWAMDPIVQSDGKLFILPSDGTFLMIYDAGSGLEVKRIAMADLENSHTLLGVNGSRLYACQDHRAVCIDWTTYNLKKATSPVWASADFESIQGRGFVAGESIILPTRAGLLAVADRGGKIISKYPSKGAAWDAKDAGNVLVTESHVVVAGADSVDVYTDTQMARVKLDREEAAAANDPNPRLRYAEIMFVGGDKELAMTKLAEAADRMGGLKNLKAGPARDRLFNDCMQFADLTARDAGAVKFTREMYDRAGAAASNASQQVNYRLARAKFEADTNNRADEVRLYQEILADPALRVVNIAGAESAEARQAATVAEEAIGKIVNSGVADAYAPYEKAASEALAAAMPAGDAAKFLSIAQLYPNSKTAPAAMLAAADAYEKATSYYDANVVLRKILSKYQTAAEKPAVLEALARNYMAMGRHEPQALRHLGQGEKQFGATKLAKPLKVANGPDLSGLTFADAAAALRKYNRTVLQTPLPEFHALPATKKDPRPAFKAETILAGVDALLTPLSTHTRYDRVVAWSKEQGLMAIQPGREQPLATTKQLDDKPLGYAWSGDTVFAWSASQVIAWKPEGSQDLWKMDLKSIPAVELLGGDKKEVAAVQPDGEDADPNVVIRQRMIIRGGGGGAAMPVMAAAGGAERIVNVRPTFDRVIISTTQGRLFALKAKDGQVAWNLRLTQSMPLLRLLATDDFTVALGPSDDQQKWFLTVLDSSSGETVRDRITFATNNTGSMIMNVALSDDGMLVYTMFDRAVGVDLYEPARKQAWYTPATVASGGRATFQGMQGERQLVISEGRVLALSNMGQFIQAFSLETGQPLQLGPGKVGSLQTQGKNIPNTSLLVAGPQVYFVSPQRIQAYNIEKIEQNWSDGVFGEKLNYRQVFLGRDHLIAVSDGTAPGVPQPAVQPSGAMTNVRLLGFSRSQGASGESGMCNVDSRLPADAQVSTVVPVEGGLYYHTTDEKLHYLAGNR